MRRQGSLININPSGFEESALSRKKVGGSELYSTAEFARSLARRTKKKKKPALTLQKKKILFFQLRSGVDRVRTDVRI